MSVDDKTPIFFAHIPKTGGMSFLRTLAQLASHEVTIRLHEFSYLFQAGNWPEGIPTQYELISGQMPNSNICNDLDADYVTKLRNPSAHIARQNNNDHHLNEFALARFRETYASNVSIH